MPGERLLSGMSEQHQNIYPSPGSAGRASEAQTVLLAQKAVSGNSHAFNQLADLYYNKIFGLVYYRIKYKMDAEDLTQEIFTQAFRNLNSLKEVEKFKSWLFSIAINKVKDFKRKNSLLHCSAFYQTGVLKTNRSLILSQTANRMQIRFIML